MINVVEFYGGPADGRIIRISSHRKSGSVEQFWHLGECYIYKFDGTRLMFVEKSKV